MHNNYYFLKQLSLSLEKTLTGTILSECFTQTKDELIIRFETKKDSFYIKATVQPNFSCLSFPEKFERARKNSVDLFSSIIGQRVNSVRQYTNERSFSLHLSDDHTILFKMHGNRSNVILFQGNTVSQLFQNSILIDEELQLDSLDRNIDWSVDAFHKHQENLQELFYTFGKIVWQYLESKDFNSKPADAKYAMIQEVRSDLETPTYYITEIKNLIHLTLLPIGVIKKTHTEPIAAINDLYYSFTNTYARTLQKNNLLTELKAKIQSNKNYIKKNREKLSELEATHNYKIWADLIMANLHAIKPNSSVITVDNFYNDNIPTEIKLKRELTPQKNAESYYRKSKNQQIEIDKLSHGITSKEAEIEKLEKTIHEIALTDDSKTLRKIESSVKAEPSKKQTLALPYTEYLFKDFRIWVGRNAEANDKLTLKLSYKDDLWLHAKDVSGSHVLIKHQAGKNFPKDVIERAAQLAAFHSKRKNESLCPVVVTPKKFVRKRKGDPAGTVVIEREEVILVEPKA